ncbi:MAG: flagellar basal-body rod protein FlgB [Phenylobacterium sp. SCN 69-14]|jgi:flagellar basal-body rod protein FlgB|nr:MAG: flagellar basal-body rod protein FlgB [Phenylobacterium sp. SCN 69-14]
MDLNEIPLFAMLKGRLGHLGERQRLISQNVANSDTPGYTPGDLKPFTFQAKLQAAQASATAQAVTQPGHMTPASQHRSPYKAVKAKDSETTLDGNSVVLEEEMLKMTEARMNYDAAISFYQKSLAMLRLASRSPGRG